MPLPGPRTELDSTRTIACHTDAILLRERSGAGGARGAASARPRPTGPARRARPREAALWVLAATFALGAAIVACAGLVIDRGPEIAAFACVLAGAASLGAARLGRSTPRRADQRGGATSAASPSAPRASTSMASASAGVSADAAAPRPTT